MSRSSGYLLLVWPQTWYMQWQLEAEQVQCHLKVIWAFITGLASNLVHVFTIEGRTCSRSSQGHLHIITGLASNLVHVITIEGRTCSKSSQGHHGTYYWIGLKLSTCGYN